MGRWQPDAAGRLQEAALALYGERGYDETTVAEIAERAGLTKRTFFRHFPDKREVLFSGSADLEALIVDGVRDAPASASPFDAIAVALDAAAGWFVDRREYAGRRQAVVLANPELLERELAKFSALATGVAEALRSRGVGDTAAILIAEAGMAVFRIGFERWVAPGNARPLDELFRASLGELRAAAAE